MVYASNGGGLSKCASLMRGDQHSKIYGIPAQQATAKFSKFCHLADCVQIIEQSIKLFFNLF